MLSIQVFVDFGKVKYVRNINSNIHVSADILKLQHCFSADLARVH